MNGLNKVMLLGTVGSDPEIRLFGENKRVVSFRMVTNKNYTDKNGEKQEKAEWHNIEAWGILADTVSTYVKKGNHIFIQGEIKTESYDDKEIAGRKNYMTKIVMNELNFLPNGKKPEGQAPQQNQQPTQQQGFVPQQPVYAPQGQPQQPVYAPQGQPQQPVYAPKVQQQPVYAPQQQQPVYAPQQQQPVYAPQQQQPAYAPQGQQQQPVYAPQGQQQQPVYAPQGQQPVNNQQVQQAQQQVVTYMTDEEFVTKMKSPDDLPF